PVPYTTLFRSGGTVQRALEAAGGVPLGQDPSTQLLASAVGEAVPGMGAGLETAQETVEMDLAVASDLLDDVAQEGAGLGGGEHGGGAGGRRDAVVPGEGVEDRGEQLAAQDLLGGEVRA